jgi:hypothetical protein
MERRSHITPLLRQMAMEKSGSSMALISHCEDVLYVGAVVHLISLHNTARKTNLTKPPKS